MLGSAQQGSFGGFDKWAAGYDRTVKTDLTLTDAHALDSTGRHVELSVALEAVDIDVCGDSVEQTFSGSWQLRRDRATWVSTDVGITKSGGGEVLTDVMRCPEVVSPPGTPDYEPPTVPDVPYHPR